MYQTFIGRGNMRVVGIDPGLTRTGVVVMDGPDTPYAYATFAADSPEYSDYQRARCLMIKIRRWLWHAMDYSVPDAVAIEKPILGRNVRNFEKQMRLFTELVSMAHDYFSSAVAEVNPMRVKKVAGGSSKLDIICASPFDGPGIWVGDDWVGTEKQAIKEEAANQEAVADAWAIAKCAYEKPPALDQLLVEPCRGPIVTGP
jgi:Holliday junction resolvasome RuvABC endonuclease subunit